MISAITAEGRGESMVFTGEFSSEVFVAFLEMLISRFDELVYLLLDGHPVHRSEMVHDWLSEHRERIRVFYLPGYSPELNPPEMLNQDAKDQVADKPGPSTLSELFSSVCTVVKTITNSGKRVAAYFHNSNLVYILR